MSSSHSSFRCRSALSLKSLWIASQRGSQLAVEAPASFPPWAIPTHAEANAIAVPYSQHTGTLKCLSLCVCRRPVALNIFRLIWTARTRIMMMCRDFQIFFVELKITINALVAVADGYLSFSLVFFYAKQQENPRKKFDSFLPEIRKFFDLILASLDGQKTLIKRQADNIVCNYGLDLLRSFACCC